MDVDVLLEQFVKDTHAMMVACDRGEWDEVEVLFLTRENYSEQLLDDLAQVSLTPTQQRQLLEVEALTQYILQAMQARREALAIKLQDERASERVGKAYSANL